MRVFNVHGHLNSPTLDEMDRMGMTGGVVLAGKGQNEAVLRAAAESQGRLIPFVFPEMEDLQGFASRLEEYRRRGARGIKLQPLVMRMKQDAPELYPVYERAAELGMACLFHCGTVAFPDHHVQFADPAPIDSVAWDFPELNIILAHLGGDFSFEALVMAEAHPNVFLDTAYLKFFAARTMPPVSVPAMIERAVRFAGAEHVLYGFEGVRPEVIMRETSLDEKTKRAILWDNAAALLRLEPA